MKKLIFATHNANKVKEVKAVFTSHQVLSLAELDYHEDIAETETTFVGNALLKARHVFEVFKTPVFADDSGLEVFALDGAPGIYSARYAGEEKNHTKNNGKLLHALENETHREGQFKTVIAYKDATTELTFEGVIKERLHTGVAVQEDLVMIPFLFLRDTIKPLASSHEK